MMNDSNIISLEEKRETEGTRRLRAFLLSQIGAAVEPDEDEVWREDHQAQDSSNDNTQTAEQAAKEWQEYLTSLGMSVSLAESLPKISIPNFENRPHQPSKESFDRIYKALQDVK